MGKMGIFGTARKAVFIGERECFWYLNLLFENGGGGRFSFKLKREICTGTVCKAWIMNWVWIREGRDNILG